LTFDAAFLRATRVEISGRDNTVFIAPENRLNRCLIHIHGNKCEVVIHEHCILSNLELWIEDDAGKIEIGSRTTVEGGHIAATEGREIVIGQDCMFSSKIEIRNGDSHAIFDAVSKERINPARPTIIGDHVWLGIGSRVLKGSSVGAGSVIAAGAIVLGHVQECAVYAGIPAKKGREGIVWKRDRAPRND
jgi:acetyltransferase-like isoleucine patch superfamily enzyme